MARPREFDERVVLDAARDEFWEHGVAATSISRLSEATGLFARQFDINVRGPNLQLGALSSAIADGGSVVFNTSVVNDVGMPNSGVYSATKGAVRSAMKVFSNELAPRQIRVNAVSPGPIDTGMS